MLSNPTGGETRWPGPKPKGGVVRWHVGGSILGLWFFSFFLHQGKKDKRKIRCACPTTGGNTFEVLVSYCESNELISEPYCNLIELILERRIKHVWCWLWIAPRNVRLTFIHACVYSLRNSWNLSTPWVSYAWRSWLHSWCTLAKTFLFNLYCLNRHSSREPSQWLGTRCARPRWAPPPAGWVFLRITSN